MQIEYVLEKTSKVKVKIDLPKGKNFFSKAEREAIKKANECDLWDEAKEFVSVKRIKVME
jgi:hypothetical protein